MKTETITLTHKEAAEGKVLTDGKVYVHEVFLASSEDAAKWHEIDEADVPTEPQADEYENTEPEE